MDVEALMGTREGEALQSGRERELCQVGSSWQSDLILAIPWDCGLRKELR